MQARIADELDRSDLTSQIQNAIQDAIGKYERRYFYFTDAPTTVSFNTVAHQEYYTSSDNAAIATISQAITLSGTFFNLRQTLDKRAWSYIEDISTIATSYAMPQDWAYLGEQIRLYPIPDNVYAMRLQGIARPVRPSTNTDTGVWMNDAEELIRTEAKLYLLRNVIRGVDMVEEIGLLEVQKIRALADLVTETASREATGQLEPVDF